MGEMTLDEVEQDIIESARELPLAVVCRCLQLLSKSEDPETLMALMECYQIAQGMSLLDFFGLQLALDDVADRKDDHARILFVELSRKENTGILLLRDALRAREESERM